MMSVLPSPSVLLRTLKEESTLLHKQLSEIVQLLKEIKDALEADRNIPPF